MLSTEQEGVILRQLSTETDDVAYWQSVEANREHLSQFGDTTSHKSTRVLKTLPAPVRTQVISFEWAFGQWKYLLEQSMLHLKVMK